MKTRKEIQKAIDDLKTEYAYILTGPASTIQINAPRALMQLSVESQLKTLHWVLGTNYISKLKGTE